MTRHILSEAKIHPSIQATVSNNHREFVEEVINVVESQPIVVIGMGINPLCKTARKLLDEQGMSHEYLEFGNYFKEWRKRNALKMWTGWKTFPMIFINGTLIGGADDLKTLIQTQTLEPLMS